MDEDQKPNTNNADGNSSNSDQNSGNEQNAEDKKFTQAEIDKIVEKRIARERSKIDAEVEKRLQEKESEAKRLAKMTDEERKDEERTKRERELEERERKIAIAEMRAEAEKQLREKSIPQELAQFIVDADAEITKTNLETMERVFNEALEKSVEERLRGKTPAKPTDNKGGAKAGVNYNPNGYIIG